MNYKKYSNNAFNLHVINTDKFKTIMVKINFKSKIKKEDPTMRNLLTKILTLSNKNYINKKELEIEAENLYDLSISTSNFISGNYIITSFNAIFLNEKYTEKNMFEKSIKFFLDLIFNPNVDNKNFAYFDLGKRLVKDEIETIKDNPKLYSNHRLLQELGKNTTLAYNAIGDIDVLNNITNEQLYDYYVNMLKTNLIDIFIIGDINIDKLKEILNNNFNINTIKKASTTHFLKHDKIKKRAQTIKETKDLEQSKLSIGFKLDNLTDFEKKYVISVYSFILGGGPDSKLFKNVREKNSLCYNIGCTYQIVNNLMIINAGINASDFKKCLNLIKKEINKMKKGDFTEEEIKAAKITYINSLKDIEDNQPSIIKIFESYEYLNFDLLDDRCKSIENVTKEDLIKFSSKIHLDTIYLLEGKNEEN